MSKRLLSVKLLALSVALLMGAGFWGGCKKIEWKRDPNRFDTEYFACYNSNGVKIIGLTDKGKELEEIVFPQYLDGFLVQYVGWNVAGPGFYSTTIKKIFMESNVKIFGNPFTGKLGKLNKIIYISVIAVDDSFIYLPSYFKICPKRL